MSNCLSFRHYGDFVRCIYKSNIELSEDTKDRLFEAVINLGSKQDILLFMPYADTKHLINMFIKEDSAFDYLHFLNEDFKTDVEKGSKLIKALLSVPEFHSKIDLINNSNIFSKEILESPEIKTLISNIKEQQNNLEIQSEKHKQKDEIDLRD